MRGAQFCLVARIGFLVTVLLTAGLTVSPAALTLPEYGAVTLPGGATWSVLAPWVLAGGIFEAVLVLRLGRLRAGSRRVILLVEALVIALSGMYAAAGVEVALVPMVCAIAAVVLLRLDHVRHSFDRAENERRLLWQPIPAVLYEGYGAFDSTQPREVQRIGYRVGVDSPGAVRRSREMSRT